MSDLNNGPGQVPGSLGETDGMTAHESALWEQSNVPADQSAASDSPNQQDISASGSDSGVDYSQLDYSRLNESIDLDQLNSFREWKSQMDRQLAEAANQQRQQQQYYEQQLRQMKNAQAQMAQAAAQYMPPEQQGNFQLLSAQAENDALRQQMQSIQDEIGKQQVVRQIAAETGVPEHELISLSDPAEMWRRGFQRKAENETDIVKRLRKLEKQLQAGDAAQAATPNGVPNAVRPAGNYQQEYDAAFRSGDTDRANQIWDQAAQANVKIDVTSWRRRI